MWDSAYTKWHKWDATAINEKIKIKREVKQNEERKKTTQNKTTIDIFSVLKFLIILLRPTAGEKRVWSQCRRQMEMRDSVSKNKRSFVFLLTLVYTRDWKICAGAQSTVALMRLKLISAHFIFILSRLCFLSLAALACKKKTKTPKKNNLSSLVKCYHSN